MLKKSRIQLGPFKGAQLLLDRSHSKRQVFGLYESVLNDWITAKTPGKHFVFDVGASDGYHTFGFAHLIKKSSSPRVIAFEPIEAKCEIITEVASWGEYKGCDIQALPLTVGSVVSDTQTTLDRILSEMKIQDDDFGLVKVDVEGAEVDVLAGSEMLLKMENVDWLIEIHGDHLIPEVAKYFVEAGRAFLIQPERKIPFLSPEQREIATYWLTTI